MWRFIVLSLVLVTTSACGPTARSAKEGRASTAEEGSGAPAFYETEGAAIAAKRGGKARDGAVFDAEYPFLSIDSGGHLAKIKKVIFTGDGRYLVSVGYDKVVRVYRTWDGSLARTLRGEIGPGKQGRIYTAALSPDNRTIALGGWLGAFTGNTYRAEEASHPIRLVDFDTGEVNRVLVGHRDVILSLSYSPDGRFVVSGSGDATAGIWDAADGTLLHVLEGHSGPVLDAAVSPNSQYIVTAGGDQTLRLWEVTSGNRISILTGHRDKVTAVAYTPDGRTIVSGGADGEIRLWDGTDGRFIRTLVRRRDGIAGLSVTPDGRRIVVGSSGDTAVGVYALEDGRRVMSFTGHENVVLTTAVSLNGRIAASAGGNNHEIFLWNIDSGEVLEKIVGAGQAVWSVGFSLDGSRIAFGNTFAQNRRDAYQLNGPLTRAFRLLRDDTYDLGMAPGRPAPGDFKRAVTTVGPWSLRTENGREHPTLEILRDGRVQRRITRNAATGYDHRAFTLTPDGELVITGGANGHLTAYRTHSGSRQQEFLGHTGDILAVAVSPDGALLVSGANDQTVRLWKVSTGELLLTLFATVDNQWVAWTPKGYYASSSLGDRYVGWHVNRGADKRADYYPARIFSDRFRSPALVAYYLEAGGAFSEAVRRYREAGHADWQETDTHTLGALAPPRPFFVTPAAFTRTVKANSLRVEARAVSDGGVPIEDIWVAVNGRRVSKDGPLKPKGPIQKRITGGEAVLAAALPLTEVVNHISVFARNRYATSEPAVLEIEREGEQVADGDAVLKPNLYLLAIGVSDNRDPDYVLDFARNDATGVKAVFDGQSGKLYKNVVARMLTDREATRGNILDGLDWIYRETTQRDTAVIFLAGHGLKDDRDNYYFLPYDGDDQALARSAVKWEAFKDVLENLPAKVILMADTCFSGNITGKHRGPKNTMDDAVRELVNSGTGVVVFTAATGRELGYEHPNWKHGAFTKAIIEGLEKRKADYNRDGRIYIKEMDLYISERVKQLTNGAQHPTTEIPATMPDFPLYAR